MFREMRRFKQQISNEECIRILKEQPRGVLSLIGDNGYPYGIPLDHWYCEDDGRLYFHGAKEGHKIDSVKACDKASYCVSVIVFGRIKLVEDSEKAKMICTEICRKFTDDEEYLAHELEHAFPRVQCLELIPEHITGKLVNES